MVRCTGNRPVWGTCPTTQTAASITLSPTSLSFASLSDTATLVATVKDASGNTMSGATVTWTTSSSSVATVSSAGLVTSVADGTATITATSGSVSKTATATVSQAASTVTVSPSTKTLTSVGDTVTLTATVKDAAGNTMSGATVTWTTSNSSVATVSSAGLVTAVADGTATITATSGSVSATASVTVSIVPSITSVSPTNWTEGASATITGSGFSGTASSNTVTVDGLTTSITSASTTELQITVPTAACKPSREVQLVVKVTSDSATKTVGVQPASITSLSVGGGVYTTSGGECLHLAAGTGSERYIVGVVSTSETASSLTSYTQSAISGTTLSSEAGEAPPAPVITSMSDDVGFFENPGVLMDVEPSAPPNFSIPASDPEYDEIWRTHYETEARRRAAERESLEALGPIDLEVMKAQIRENQPDEAVAANVVAGQTEITIRVEDDSSLGYTEITAVVTHIGTSAIFLEDAANPYPAAGLNSFTTAEYQAWDATLTAQTMPTIKSYFGDIANVNGLGIEPKLGLTDTNKIAVMITKEVNKGGAVGFASSGDLYAQASVSSSDEMEIFYGLAPDPNGVHGNAKTRAFLLNEYPTLLAHETVHILQNHQKIYNFPNSAQKTQWEQEGAANLAEQLVGNAVLSHGGSGQNLGLTEFLEGYSGNPWYKYWGDDLLYYLGTDASFSSKVSTAPEQCTWLANDIGPCLENGRAVYGPPASLLRMILDKYGPSYSGGEAALMKALTTSTQSGFSNLAATTGDSIGLLLTLFGMNLYTDGRVWHSSSFTSWDLYPIMAAYGTAGPLSPYTSSADEPTGNLSVRAGSTSYLDWTPSSSHAPTSFRIRTQAGADLPDEMVLWIFRIE